MAPWVGIEPTTNGLTVRRSTAELPGNTRKLEGTRIVRITGGIVKIAVSRHGSPLGPTRRSGRRTAPYDRPDSQVVCDVAARVRYRREPEIHAQRGPILVAPDHFRCEANARANGILEPRIGLGICLLRHQP